MNKKTIITGIAIASSATAIAFFSYKLWKTYKEMHEDLTTGEEIGIDIETLRVEEMTESMEELGKVVEVQTQSLKELAKEYAEVMEDDDDGWPLNEDLDYYDDEWPPIEEEFDIELDEEVFDEEIDEDVEQLRYEPNSPEALQQYINMRLAEFDSTSEFRSTMVRLFEVPFVPTNDDDHNLIGNIQDRKEEFFGDSDHIYNTTIGDLLEFWAFQTDFDINGGIEIHLQGYLSQLGLWTGMGVGAMDTVVNDLVNHRIKINGKNGMFAIGEQEYLEAANNPNVNIKSFRAQYNVFLSYADDMDYE